MFENIIGYDYVKEEFSNETLKQKVKTCHSILKQILMKVDCNYGLIDKQIELLEYENDLIRKTKSESRIEISSSIKSYLSNNNIKFYVMGNLTSSYFAYLLHIHNVDTLKYNIKPEMCYGLDNNKNAFSLDFHIPIDFETKTYDILTDILPKDYVYSVCFNNDETNESVVIPFMYAFSNDEKVKEEAKIITSDGKEYRCLSTDQIRENDEIIKINLICDIYPQIYNNKVTFEDIDRTIEDVKMKFVDEILYRSEVSENTKNNIADNIHSSYDLALWAGLFDSTYHIRRIPSELNELDEIVFRDDVYNYLLASEVEKEKAYDLTMSIGKGKYADVEKELEEEFIRHKERDKYKNVVYLFPKGHVLAEILKMAKKIL